VKDVHGVDDERGVGRVLSGGIAELLGGLNRKPLQVLLPAPEVRRCPIPVGALDGRRAISRDFGQQQLGHAGLGVIGVYEHRQAVG